MRLPLPALLLCLMTPPATAACTLDSGPATQALVELYSSEGCSSCPPADRRLSRLTGVAGVVPLALHVPYWDALGWRDPFAQPGFARRQEWLVQANGHQTLYTPHLFVSGTEVRDWRSGLDSEVRRVNARPARAHVLLQGAWRAPTLSLAAEAEGPAAQDLELLLAVTQSGLDTPVGSGENAGARLHHDHVVRHWLGPFPLRAGRVQVRTQVDLPGDWDLRQVGLVAFVQNAAMAEVLQAVGQTGCLAPLPAR